MFAYVWIIELCDICVYVSVCVCPHAHTHAWIHDCQYYKEKRSVLSTVKRSEDGIKYLIL